MTGYLVLVYGYGSPEYFKHEADALARVHLLHRHFGGYVTYDPRVRQFTIKVEG